MPLDQRGKGSTGLTYPQTVVGDSRGSGSGRVTGAITFWQRRRCEATRSSQVSMMGSFSRMRSPAQP